MEDDKQAAALVLDLLTLAPLVPGKEGTKPLHSSCQFFSTASFAASALLKALIDSYKAAAARHRAASQEGSDPLTYFVAHAPVAPVLDDDEPMARIALLLSHKGEDERVRWEMKCVKAVLRSAQELMAEPVAGVKEYQRVSLYSYKPMSPLVDRHDGLWEVLHGAVGDSWRQQLRSTRSLHSKEQPMFHLVMDMMCSAPLAHARVHKALFKRAWSPSSVHEMREVLLELLGKRVPLPRSFGSTELGLSLHDGKFGNGRSIFSSYVDLEVKRAHDPMVQGHDDEWTQTRRIDDAQRDIEAKMGRMHAPFEEMSGGINGSMFFSMAAVEKKLELKIPPPVYPEMRPKRAAAPPLPAIAPPKEEEQKPPKPPVEAESAPAREQKPAWGKAALSFADILRKGSESSGAPARSIAGSAELKEVDNTRPLHQASKWPRPHDSDKWVGGDSEGGLPANRPKQPQPSPSAWGQRKGWGVQGQTFSAAQAAQAATGVLFAETCQGSSGAHPPAWPSVAHSACNTGSSLAPTRTPERKEEMPSHSEAMAREENARQRLRYNPLRPQHAALAHATDMRRATARRLHVEMLEFLREMEPTQCSRRHRDEIVEQVKAAVAASCPDASVEVYGSYATDLFLSHSDVDLLVMHAKPSASKSALQIVSERLRGMTWCRYIKTIETILVPVVKVTADVSLLDTARSVAADKQVEHLDADKQVEHIDAKHEEQRACIAVDVTFDCNIGDAPLRLRDFVCAQLKRFPIIRPLVLVLKHLLFKQGLNDYYKGGLSSHSVVLLLIFYFSIPEVAAAHEAGLDRESPGYIDQGCWYGEWLMRLMQWLSEFPFSDVGIAVEPMSYVPLTDYGYGMLIMGECDPGLPDVTGESNVLHIEDPFNKDPVDPTKPSNIAQGCFEWYLVRRCLQGAFRILSNHREPAPHLRIFGGVAESPSPLASILDRSHVTASVAALLKEQADKRLVARGCV